MQRTINIVLIGAVSDIFTGLPCRLLRTRLVGWLPPTLVVFTRHTRTAALRSPIRMLVVSNLGRNRNEPEAPPSFSSDTSSKRWRFLPTPRYALGGKARKLVSKVKVLCVSVSLSGLPTVFTLRTGAVPSSRTVYVAR